MMEGGGETKLLECQAQEAEVLDQDRCVRSTHVVEAQILRVWTEEGKWETEMGQRWLA